MAASEQNREELEEKLQEAYNLIEQEAPLLPERLYNALEGISSVFLAYKKGKGRQGWSQSLVGLNKKALFTSEQSKQLEKVFNHMGPQMVELFGDDIVAGAMLGGGLGDIKTGASSQLLMPSPMLSPEEISIDKIYHTITTKMDEYDEQWGEIANGFGIVQAVERQDYRGVVGAPPVVIPYYIPGKLVLPLLNTVLDLIRLALGNPAMDFVSVRILLSFVLSILELVRGDWQNAFISSWGMLSAHAVVIGFFLKMARNAFLLIAPDLRRQLRDDIFKSSKSMFAGFLLWAFGIFSPDFIRMSVQKSFDSIGKVVNDLNQKIDQVQDQANQVAEKAGIKLTFPKLPLEMIPSMDDLQNLQSLARVPEVYCSKEVQAIIQPLLIVPPLRLVLELLNIPTVSEDIEEQCSKVDDEGLANAVAEKAQPKIDIIPGGPINQASKMAEQASELAEMASDPTAALEKKASEATETIKGKAEETASKAKKAVSDAVPKPPKLPRKGGGTRRKSRSSKKRKTQRRR